MAFFDNVGKKLSQAGQGALQKTKEMADIARLNSLIADEEKRLNNNYYQIGKLYAQLHSADCEDCFTTYISAVNESLKKTDDLKAELQALRAVAKCPNCGAEVPISSMFCNACGTAMPNAADKTVTQPADSVKCNNCGAFVNKNMRFCTSCGTPMVQNNSNNDVVAEPVKVEDKSKCTSCGAELDEDSAFCAECGTKIY